MANKKISELPEATDVVGAQVEVIQGGVNKRASSTLFGSGGGNLQSITTGAGNNETTNPIKVKIDDDNYVIINGSDISHYSSGVLVSRLDYVNLILTDGANSVQLNLYGGLEMAIGGNTVIINPDGITLNGIFYQFPSGVSSPLATLADITGGGATNLGYTASPTNGIVTSDTGTDATIPLADITNAGLLSPSEKAEIASALQPSDLTPIQTELDEKQTNFYKDASTSTAVTGTTANTILVSRLIPANTFAVGTAVEVRCNVRRVGNNGSAIFRKYVNTIDDLAGATQFATYTSPTSGFYSPFKRLLGFKTGNQFICASSTTNVLNDEVVTTVAPSFIPFDPTIDNYIIEAVQPISTLDSFTSEIFTIKGNK